MTSRNLGKLTVGDDVFSIRRLWLGEGIVHLEARAKMRSFPAGRRDVAICDPDGFLVGTVSGLYFQGVKPEPDEYVVVDIPIELTELTATNRRRPTKRC